VSVSYGLLYKRKVCSFHWDEASVRFAGEVWYVFFQCYDNDVIRDEHENTISTAEDTNTSTIKRLR